MSGWALARLDRNSSQQTCRARQDGDASELDRLFAGGLPRTPEGIVSSWVDAFNARDLERMLFSLSNQVDFHPLRLSGVSACYRGHDGVRRWFAQLQHAGHEHRIALSEVRSVGEDRVLAVGALVVAGGLDIGPFWALHRIADGVIATAHDYLTDPEMIEYLGLIP